MPRFLSLLRIFILALRGRPVALASALALACVPTATAPRVAPSGKLSLQSEQAGPRNDGPFRVVFAGPRGEVNAGAQISIVLSRPLRALELAADTPLPDGITVEPPIAGSFRWVGTSALSFSPQGGRLPLATSYRVTVPAGLRALDGSTLGQPYEFEFSTPRPKLVSTTPYAGQTGLEPSTTFELRFNQSISLAELKRNLHLSATTKGKRTSIPLLLDVPEEKHPKHVRARPQTRLPASSTIELALSQGTRGTEGPLPTGQDQVLSFETYGRLSVTHLDCSRDEPKSRCAPGGGVWLSLSNPVKMRDLKRAIVVEPAVALIWESWRDDADDTSNVDLNAAFLPGENYTISVASSLRDVYGQTLGSSFRQTLPIDDYAPRVEIGVSGDYFEPTARAKIPVASVNVQEYSLWTAPLSLSQVLTHEARDHDDGTPAFDALVTTSGARARVVRPSNAKNQPGEQTVDPALVLGSEGGRGPVLIAARYAGKRKQERTQRIVQVTDLGITAKLSRSASSVVWVTELGSGRPVPSAEVSVLGAHRPANGPAVQTDKDGIAVLPPGALGENPRDDSARLLIVVKKGNDWSYRRVSDYLSPWRSDVATDLFGQPANYGLLFTERGLYRPGDTVELKGILRKEAEAGNELLAARKYTLELRSPSWDVLETYPITTTAFGTFAKSIRIPASSPLGGYRLEVKELAQEGSAATYFEVAEYTPIEMKAELSSDQPSYQRGGKARFSISGDYLFGSPMVDAPLTFRVTRSETSWQLPGATEFVSDASAYDSAHPERAPSSGMLQAGDGKLDERGLFEFTLPLELPGQRGPELVSVDAEITDVSRQTVAASSSRVVHPADFYAALAPLDNFFVDVGREFRPRALAVAPGGQRLSNKSIHLELIRRRWTLVRETTGGSSHSEMRALDAVVSTCTVASTTSGASCGLTSRDPGYHLVVATARDDKGREVRAAIDAYAIGSGDGFWRDDDTQRVELAANKKQYKPGDVARVLVKSPFPSADALVTVEGDGVRYQRRVSLSGPTPTIEVPITEQMRPNVYVAVHLIRPRSKALAGAGKPDVGAPTFRTGHVQLLVDPEARRLQVELTPNKKEFLPGEEIDIALGVSDAHGKGTVSEVTVYAVDEGVLSLIGYRTPDPLPVFTAPRPLRTATLESREALARVTVDLGQLLGLGPNKGSEGGGGGEASGARRDFRQSAYFNPAVLTGADGKARLRFKLPDSLTTYRLMAVATTQSDRYGYAETRVVTSKNLMARPALPRFLRAGDSAEAGVIVSAKDFGPAEVTVTLKARGIEVAGPTTQTIQLAKNGSTEARFSLLSPTVGAAQLHFDVRATSQGKTWQDAVIVNRTVQSPAVLETVALYGETARAAAEELGDLSAIRRDVGQLELSAASSALVGLDSGFDQLLEYPYGCTEQLTSRLLPLLPLRDLAQSYGVALPKNPDALIEKTLADILSRQRGDGGFGMWPEARESSLWASPYALWALHEAASRKFSINKAALRLGLDFLRRKLAEEPSALGFVSSAFHVDVLAMMGEPDPGYMNSLFERRAELPVFARAFLLHAMAISKQPATDVALLSTELENQIRVAGNRATFVENLGDEYAPLMDSPTRTTALVLRALLAARPAHPLGSLLARGLLAARQKGAWRSTQETAFALLALDAYQRAQETTRPDFTARFWQGDTSLFEGRFEGRSTQSLKKTVPSAHIMAGPLVFEKEGPGTLFYEARLRYARKVLPTNVLDRGFFVQKTLRRVTPNELTEGLGPIPQASADSLPAGALTVVDLVIVASSPRNYAVIDDPLPAGLEAVNSSLATSAAWTRIPGSSAAASSWSEEEDDDRAHGDGFQWSDYRRELRDDRVLFFVDHLPAGIFHYRYLARATTPGRFVLPPTRAEEMYSPEVFGRTGVRTVEVK